MRANDLFPQLEIQRFNSDEFMMWVDFFAERYGQSPQTILDLPIPVFQAMQEAVNKRNEMEKKQIKRSK